MDFLEKDLEQIIYDSLQTDEGCNNLHSRGLSILCTDFEIKKPFKIFRQLKIGNYGVADIVIIKREYSYDFDDNIIPILKIIIIELKKNKICNESLIQLYRYKKGVKRYLAGLNILTDFTCCLIGRDIVNDDYVYLFPEIGCLSVYKYDYCLDGLSFEEQDNDFILIDEGFDYGR